MIDVAKYKKMIADSTPGKFEGEPAETAYFYEKMLDGMGEYFEDLTYFDLSQDEIEAFELDAEKPVLILEEDSQGFVTSYQVTKIELDNYLDSMLAEDEDSDEDFDE